MPARLTEIDLDELEAVGCGPVSAAPGEDRRFKKFVRLGLLQSIRDGRRVLYTTTDRTRQILRLHRPEAS